MTLRAPPRIGLRLLLTLIAGRASYRTVTWAATPILATLWGRDRFAPYAAALGGVGWLAVVMWAGPEKASLKLIPRARHTRAELVAAGRALAALAPVPFLAATAMAVLVAPSSMTTMRLAAATYYVTQGCTLVILALYRVLGRAGRDTMTFLALTAGTLLLLAVTVAARLPPLGFLCATVAISFTVNMVLLRGPGARVAGRAARRYRWRIRRLLAASAALMGMNEVLINLSQGLLFIELSLTSRAEESTELFLVTQTWALFVSFVYFVQRVFQPRMSARLAGNGAVGGVRAAVRLARAGLAVNAAWLAVAGTLLATGSLGAGAGLVALGALQIARAPIYLIMSQSTYLLENSDADGLRTCVYGSALGAVAVLTAGLALIPPVGAAGALCALALRELLHSVVILTRYRDIGARETIDGAGNKILSSGMPMN